MKAFLWFLLELVDNNRGYSTPIQKRYNIGDVVKISGHHKGDLPIHTPVTIVEFGRHDYLIEDHNRAYHVVFQFELYD